MSLLNVCFRLRSLRILLGVCVCAAFVLPALARAASPSAVESLQDALIHVAEKLKPSVVNISSEQIIKRSGREEGDDLFKGFPFGDIFPPVPVPRPRGAEKEVSLGTGIVIQEDGYILTNNHVIKGATAVKVVFDAGSDQPDAVLAKIVATDVESDIAVLKIPRKGLQPVEFGDSDTLKVGSLVVAIGSPYRFEHTVTFGVVSAKGRHLINPEDNTLTLQDYIQTDASINRGNSGGPLVDIHGKVVGINTAIWTPTGGNIGIGFAVPINSIKPLLPRLIRGEKIDRGWLGIEFEPVSRDAAEFLGISQGFQVRNILPGGPAEKAGMKQGDILVELDGRKLTSSEQLRTTIANTAPGKSVKVKVLRIENNKSVTKELTVTLGERPSSRESRASAESQSLLGLSVQETTPDNLRRYRQPENSRGVIVTLVDPGGPADEARVQVGDLITAIGKTRDSIVPVRNLAEYNQAVGDLKPGDRILLSLQTNDGKVRMPVLTARKVENEKKEQEQ